MEEFIINIIASLLQNKTPWQIMKGPAPITPLTKAIMQESFSVRLNWRRILRKRCTPTFNFCKRPGSSNTQKIKILY